MTTTTVQHPRKVVLAGHTRSSGVIFVLKLASVARRAVILEEGGEGVQRDAIIGESCLPGDNIAGLNMPAATQKPCCPAVHSHDIIDTAVVAATCAQASNQELGVGPPCKRAPFCVGLFSVAGLAHVTLGSVLAPKGTMGVGPSLATLVQLM